MFLVYRFDRPPPKPLVHLAFVMDWVEPLWWGWLCCLLCRCLSTNSYVVTCKGGFLSFPPEPLYRLFVVCQCRKIHSTKVFRHKKIVSLEVACQSKNWQHFCMSPTCRRHFQPSCNVPSELPKSKKECPKKPLRDSMKKLLVPAQQKPALNCILVSYGQKISQPRPCCDGQTVPNFILSDRK